MSTSYIRVACAWLALIAPPAAARATPGSAALPARQGSARAQTSPLRFDFGPGRVARGYTRVLASNVYTKETGYGFEPGAEISCADRGGGDALRGDLCAGERPFYLSAAVAEGNYNVTVTFGDRAGETATTVKAELRRLMLEEVRTARGKFETRTFTANVRRPDISAGGGAVRLQDRERATEAWAWDEKLTLKFNNLRPSVCAVEIAPADTPTVFLLGDSTVADQPREPYNSWGQMLPRFLRPGVAVANHAESGESLRSSLGARRLEKVLSVICPGDYLFVQYGHNDEKERGEGVGAFTTYKASLKHYLGEARRRGATVVLVTPVQRRTFDTAGKITDSHGDHDDDGRQAAQEVDAPLIDLHAMSEPFYEALGPEESKKAFAPGDGTHHNNYGSYELARCVVEGIRANRFGLAKFIAKDAGAFDPARPDPVASFKVPTSPLNTDAKPLGN